MYSFAKTFLIGLILACLSVNASAQLDIRPPKGTIRVYSLTPLDKQYQDQQRQRIDNLARMYLGQQLRGDKQQDLELLQRLLDGKFIKAEQTQDLQAMGVVVGDLLADELGMNWVIYEDHLGRSRALRLYNDKQILFPITMISRRVEVGINVDVNAVYEKALGIMQPQLKRKPYH